MVEPPVFAILNDLEVALSPLERVKLIDVVSTERTGAEFATVSVTLTVCGLLAIAVPSLTPASEIEPVYVPAANEDDLTVTVKGVLSLEIVAEGGVTDNQPVPLSIEGLGVIVTPSAHDPETPIVKVWVSGFDPTLALKLSLDGEGACNVQGDGCVCWLTKTVIANCAFPPFESMLRVAV